MGVYGHHQPPKEFPKEKSPSEILQDDLEPIGIHHPTEHDESDEIEQAKIDEHKQITNAFISQLERYDELNATGTFLTLMWDFRWITLPVLMIALYEPVYWTLLNLWCWLYGIFY